MDPSVFSPFPPCPASPIQVKRLRPEAVLPQRATEDSAGMDLCACLSQPLTLAPGDLAKIPTGLAIALPGPECAAFLFARSGLGVKHGICLSNGVGVVDSDYRGEIQVGLCNVGKEPYTISPGERIAQMVILPVWALPLVEVRELEETSRGEGGFGSTGTAALPGQETFAPEEEGAGKEPASESGKSKTEGTL